MTTPPAVTLTPARVLALIARALIDRPVITTGRAVLVSTVTPAQPARIVRPA